MSSLADLLASQSAQLGTLRNQRIVPREEYLHLTPPHAPVVEHAPLANIADRGLPADIVDGIAVVVEEQVPNSNTHDEDYAEDDDIAGIAKEAVASQLLKHLQAVDDILTQRNLRRRSSMRMAGSNAAGGLDPQAPLAPAGLVSASEEALLARIVTMVSSASEPLVFSNNELLDRHRVSEVWLLWKQVLLAEEQAIVTQQPEAQVSTILLRHLRSLDSVTFDMAFNSTNIALHGRALLNAVTYAIQNCSNDEKFAARFERLGVRHCSFGITPDRLDHMWEALVRTIEDIRDRVWFPDNAIRCLHAIVGGAIEHMKQGGQSQEGVDAVLAFAKRQDDEVVALLELTLKLENADDRGLPETFMFNIVAATAGAAMEEGAAGNSLAQAVHGVSQKRLRELSRHQSMRKMAKFLKLVAESYRERERCERLLFDLGVRHKNYGVTPSALSLAEDEFIAAVKLIFEKRKHPPLEWRRETLLRRLYRFIVEHMSAGLTSTIPPPPKDDDDD